MKPNTITTILLCAMVAALWMSGCQRIDPPRNYPETPDSSASLPERPDSFTVRVAAGDTAYIHSDHDMRPVPANRSEIPNSSQAAAKVAAVMAANDITLPQVVAYLNTYNLDVVDRTAWMRPHWRASAVDAQHPRPTYYLFRPYIAVADTTVEFMVRRNIAGAWPADVQGVYINPSGVVLRGPLSLIGWSDNGTGTNALPGVRP